jgi:hypothetical protein
MGRVTEWIVAAARMRGRPAASVDCVVLTPAAPPPDQERVARVGDVLHACYDHGDEALDDKLTALMLRLTVEPQPPPTTRKR